MKEKKEEEEEEEEEWSVFMVIYPLSHISYPLHGLPDLDT